DPYRADALRMHPHVVEGEVGAVGDPVDVPFLDREGLTEFVEVVGAFQRVVGAEVDAAADQLGAALLRRGDVGATGRGRVVGQVERFSSPAVDDRAGQLRPRRVGAAL